jgi:glucose/arabinose dehydrogenase
MHLFKWLTLGLLLLTRYEALGTLPSTIALKPYQIKASAAFSDCVSFQEIPGKSGAFVVVQKNGSVLYYEPKTGKTSPWIKITVNTIYEEGLYTIAFHPDFEKNGRYFALYSPESNASVPGLNYGHPGQYREALVEYLADANHEKDSGLPSKLIAEFCCKDGPGHNGMFPIFGKDRFLYFSFGDGNSDGRETQSKKSFLGTISRIDVDHVDPGKNYAIPKDNPFINDPDPAVKKEIWAYGFRNNFNLSADALTGDIWVGNVGGWNEDHVSLVRKGNNFGWPITEASVCFDNSKSMFQYTAPLATCDRTGITPPTIPVPHSLPRGNVNTNCVIGPVVYRGNPNSPLYGVVFYADFTAQKLMAARLDAKGNVSEQAEYLKTTFQIVHLQESSDGRILVSGLNSSQFFYLDDPGLLMGSATGVKAKARIGAPVQFGRGEHGFTASGRRRLGGNAFQKF